MKRLLLVFACLLGFSFSTGVFEQDLATDEKPEITGPFSTEDIV